MTTRPEKITGGCLCGAIRFTIRFPEGSAWPPKDKCICECTMCRKHTGCLLPHMATFPHADIEPALSSSPTFKTYKSSSWGYRSFCSTCGSTIGYHEVDKADQVDLYVGLIDEEWLCGKRLPGTEKKDESGRYVKREKLPEGFANDLTGSPKWMFEENAVPAVTDNLPGRKKFYGGRSDAGVFSE